VIHAATMEPGGPTSAEVIRRATASTLAKADELGARSLALVAFGTGVGGGALDEAARIEVEEVQTFDAARTRARRSPWGPAEAFGGRSRAGRSGRARQVQGHAHRTRRRS
jgi:O-acetyl-ADP-ribose deacetylase (regulator of RNase III)